MNPIHDRSPRLVKCLARGLLLMVAAIVQEPAMAQAEPSAAIAATTAPVQLGAVAVSVPLVPVAAADTIKRRLLAVAAGHEIRLVIDGLHVERDPGALYRVELVAMDGSDVTESVGSFNVFGVAHAQGATAQRSFIVTAPLRRLGGRGVIVRFAPDAAVASDARVRVGRLSLVEQ